jgi:uncharacterized protein YegL
MIRRLPVYFLLDCSRSMDGEPRLAIQQGFKALVANFQDDPQCLETMWLSVIVFATDAWQFFPLSEITSLDFRCFWPIIDSKDESALGAALAILNRAIDREVLPKTTGHLGDYRPLVIIMIDGEPTDNWQAAAKFVLERNDRKPADVLLIGMGSQVNPTRLAASVSGIDGIASSDLSPERFMSLWRWVDQ